MILEVIYSNRVASCDCVVCGSHVTEDQGDLSQIRFRKVLCPKHYMEERGKANARRARINEILDQG